LSENILQLWDFFLTSGWKAIFITSLYFMKENEQEML
jgi:hypothetical protein